MASLPALLLVVLFGSGRAAETAPATALPGPPKPEASTLPAAEAVAPLAPGARVLIEGSEYCRLASAGRWALCFAKGGKASGLWAVDVDGKATNRRLAVKQSWLSWDDHDRVVYLGDDGKPWEVSLSGNALAPAPAKGAVGKRISPDGRWVALEDKVVSADKTRSWPLPKGAQYRNDAFSSDSARFTFTTEDDDDGQVLELATGKVGPFISGVLGTVAGVEVVWESRNKGETLFWLEPNGEQRPASPFNGEPPVISRDRKRLAFFGEGGRVYLVERGAVAAAGVPVGVGDVRLESFTPDGNRVIYVRWLVEKLNDPRLSPRAERRVGFEVGVVDFVIGKAKKLVEMRGVFHGADVVASNDREALLLREDQDDPPHSHLARYALARVDLGSGAITPVVEGWTGPSESDVQMASSGVLLQTARGADSCDAPTTCLFDQKAVWIPLAVPGR